MNNKNQPKWISSLYYLRNVQIKLIFGIKVTLGLEWKLTFSSPVATAEFSKFAGILSATLSQHYLPGFEIVQLEFHHLH